MPTRSMRYLRVVALLIWCCGLAAFIYALGTPDPFLPALSVFPGWGTIGMLLAVRRPTNVIGWLLLLIGSVVILSQVPVAGDHPEILNGVFIGTLGVVLVVFPTGRPTRRMWYLPMAMVGVGMLGSGVGVISAGGAEWPIGVAVAIVGIVWCGAAPILRFRRSGGVERAQLRWVGVAVGMSAASALVMMVGFATAFEPAIGLGGPIAAFGAVFGVPLSILLAVTRYRLYDIERLVSRTVTYAIVAGVVAATFAIPAVLLPELLNTSSDLVVAGATLLAAGVAIPVRRRVQNRVDRYFNRAAFDRAVEMEAFTDSLRSDPDVLTVPSRALQVVDRMLQPRSVALWLPGGSLSPPPPTNRRV